MRAQADFDPGEHIGGRMPQGGLARLDSARGDDDLEFLGHTSPALENCDG